ncbi:alpha-hydroxy acid oxidase [Amphritea pacifica]|uniref:Alpha-hydroxy-acid oxidizing protein n=1 Tax=Amphritea pacifica TaxID=2811233 RepID=A0ABS2WAJ4_9GAMM|nr:alpha-hydroxy acid oxidase [Amphritea pacifica]MBN0988735.1 alpha-hydroxy-acid oxidizing protein [Amphritea pacifica]
MNTHTPHLSPLDYIPAEIACARDYVSLAQRFIPADILAYISGGSGQDITLHNNETAFHRWAITPRVMPAPENATTAIQLFGEQLRHPLLLAPVAYQTLVHPQGELATAYAAKSTDTCMLASTLSSVTLEQIAQRSTAERWFQLYFQPRQENTNALIQRAIAAGYQAIVVTLDAAIQAPSLRAVRAGFKRPETVKAANLIDPGSDTPRQHSSGESRIFRSRRENAPTLQQLQQLIDESPVPVIIKGVLHPEDAGLLQQSGAAGIIVSNHGGRTLDGAPASLSVLPAIRTTVGDQYPLLFDSGIRSGSDVFKAIALGADAVLIGRLQLYALSVAGALGVAHMIKLLREELELCMAMSGCATLADIRATELHKPF